MAMTSEEKKDVREYCAFLLKEHGFHFSPDDPVVPALYIIYLHMKASGESNRALASQIQQALLKINPNEFHFHHKGEAWTFQMAGALKLLLVGLFLLSVIWTGICYWSRINDVEQARVIVQSSGSLRKLFRQVQKTSGGIFFIDFTANRGDSIRHFTEFERINKSTVRVYLGKDLRSGSR